VALSPTLLTTHHFPTPLAATLRDMSTAFLQRSQLPSLQHVLVDDSLVVTLVCSSEPQ
jgi:hypothetical protein